MRKPTHRPPVRTRRAIIRRNSAMRFLIMAFG